MFLCFTAEIVVEIDRAFTIKDVPTVDVYAAGITLFGMLSLLIFQWMARWAGGFAIIGALVILSLIKFILYLSV